MKGKIKDLLRNWNNEFQHKKEVFEEITIPEQKVNAAADLLRLAECRNELADLLIEPEE